jgi:dihydrolipoamide dehydrogenase
MRKRLEPQLEALMLGTKVSGLKEKAGHLHVTFEGADVDAAIFDKALVAVGRAPNSSGIGLRNTAVRIDGSGFVIVDEQRRTAEPNIFAIGDVTGSPMLAHKATHEGLVAAEVIAGVNSAFTPAAIPAVVFTDPEIAWCGLSEDEAKAKGRDVAITRFPWQASGRATTLNRTDGLTKLIVDPNSERLLGVGIVGVGAGELIAGGATAIEMGATAEDLAKTIHPHPTLSETIMEAAEGFFGQTVHLHKRRS